jgi:hypothetical protein
MVMDASCQTTCLALMPNWCATRCISIGVVQTTWAGSIRGLRAARPSPRIDIQVSCPQWALNPPSFMCLSMANERFHPRLVPQALALMLGVLSGEAAIASGGPPEPVVCHFVAFVEESDPAGLNVRAGPSTKAAVVGTLPPVWKDDEGMQARVVVKVTGTANGWFRIREAFDDESLTGQPARPAYAGVGWVSGRKLVVKSEANAGHSRPDRGAPVTVQLKDDLVFDGNSTISAGRPVDCKGGWVLVDYDESRFSDDMRPFLQISTAARAGQPKGRFRTWLDKICGIQETSCDGASREDSK